MIKKLTTSDLVVQQISQNILKGRLKPGEALPSYSEMADMLKVGKSSIREALIALEYLDVLYKDTQGRVFVNEDLNQYFNKGLLCYFLIDKKKNIHSLFEIRGIFEPRLTYLAAMKSEEGDLENIYQCMIEAEKNAEDAEKYAKANRNYHLSIAQAAKNNVLFGMTYKIKDLIVLAGYSKNSSSHILQSLKWHQKIFKAIQSRDPVKASQYMFEHIKSVYQKHF